MTGKFKKGDKVRAHAKTKGSHLASRVSKYWNHPLYILKVNKDYYSVASSGYINGASAGDWYAEEDLTLWEKTMDDLQVGDILVNDRGDDVKVLAICGLVYFISLENNFEKTGYFECLAELKERYSLEPEEPTPTNMTLEEIEEALGKKINIVDSKEQ